MKDEFKTKKLLLTELAEIRRRIAELEAAEIKYRNLVEQIPAITYIAALDGAGSTLYVSPQIESILGFTQSEWMFDPELWSKSIHPDDRDRVLTEVVKFKTGKEPLSIEYRLLSRDGRERWVRDVAIVVKNEAGKSLFIQGIIFDITELKCLDDTSQKNKALVRQIMEVVPVGVWVADKEGQILYGNQVGRQIWSGAKYVGLERYGEYKGWWVDTGKRIEPHEWALAQAVTKGETSSGEVIEIECFDGTNKIILNSAAPIRGSNYEITGAVAVNEDITELYRLKEQYRNIIGTSMDGFWVVDSRGKFLDANDAYCNLIGYSRDELLRMSIQDVEAMESPEETAERIRAVMESGHDRFETRHRCKDGRIVDIEVSTNIMKFDGVRFFVFLRDITARKRTEAEIRKLNLDLDRRVRERTSEVEAANRALSDEITERRKAENTLCENAQRLRVALSGIDIAVFHQDCDLRYTWMYQPQIGYTADQVLGKTDAELLSAEAARTVMAIKRRVVETGQGAHTEVGVATPEGMRLFDLVVEPLRDEHGETVGLTGASIDITERKVAEERMRLQLAALEAAANSIWVTDRDGIIQWVNQAFTAITGYGATEVVGQNPRILKSGQHNQGYFKNLWDTILAGNVWRGEIINRRKDGSLYTDEQTITPVRDPQGNISHFVAVNQDITERKRSEELVRKLSAAVEGASDWILMTDRNGNIEYVNKAVEEISGYSKDELSGQNARIFKSSKHDTQFYREMWNTILSGRTFYGILTNRKKNGEIFELYHTITPLKDSEGNITHFITTSTDLTNLQLMEEKINYLAYYDVLTEIPNRTLFVDRLNQSLDKSRYEKRNVAIFCIDLDRFKLVNDIFGANLGDIVLREVAKRLTGSVREGDTVARLGSDEFGIALSHVGHSEDVILVAEKVMRNISEVVAADGREIMITPSVGIAISPSDGDNPLTLMQNAELALSKAKEQGGNNYQFYTREMNIKASDFVIMRKHLFDALKHQEFVLYYQPYWEMTTKKVTGMEALMRWKSNEFGMVSPGKFIPVLEETGMIIEVGEWVLETALGQVKEWFKKGYPVVPVSVNFSSVQFRHKELAVTVGKMIERFGLDPKLLTLEITESAFMKDIEFTASALKKLKEIGTSISIDDFGTGYSSLSYLKRFPVDTLKIDISFIRDIATDPDAASIVTAIISMAHTLNLKTIAEGIETEEQWKILRLLRCDMGQGYFFSKPLPASEVEVFLISP